MTKTQTYAEIFYNPKKRGYTWRITHVPGRFVTQPAGARKPFKSAVAARESLETAIGLLRLEIPASQIKQTKSTQNERISDDGPNRN